MLTTWRSSLTNAVGQIRYAYLVTLLAVILGTITTAYSVIRSYLFSQMFRARAFTGPGNFTGTQFGNFTRSFARTQQFANLNPYGGLIGDLAILGMIIAIVGVLWLGISLNKSHKL